MHKRIVGRAARREAWAAYGFVLPQIVGLLLFFAFPAGMTAYLSFSEWNMLEPPVWKGGENFAAVFADDRLSMALQNTALFILAIVPVTMGIALGLALALNRPFRGMGWIKAAVYLPQATASVGIVLVWYWLFAPNIGLINYVLGTLGLEGPNWLLDKLWARTAIVMMSAWQGMGFYFIILLAGLKNISPELYEAASMDGATYVQKFRYITFPQLSSSLFFVLVTMTIGLFNLFNEPMILTEGGPEFATYTLTMYIYDLGFRYFRMGEAAVVSLVLLAAVVAVTALQFKLSKKWVYTGD